MRSRVTGLLCLLLLPACEEEGITLEMMADVLGTVPTFAPEDGQALAGDAVTDNLVLNFFGLECHHEGETGECPAGVPVNADTKYSTDTLLGVLAHGELYSNEVFGRAGRTSCRLAGGSNVRTASVSLASFVSADGDGTRFIVDELSRLECVGADRSTRWAAWSLPTATRLENIVIEKGANTGSADQSAVQQQLVLLDGAGAPRAVALNVVNITLRPDGSAGNMRALLVANFETRRFLVQTGGGPLAGGVVAGGQAGLSPEGALQPGVYAARSVELQGAPLCIDNATRVQADPAACAVESAAWAAGTTPGSWLGLTADDEALFAGYLAFFAEGAVARPFAPEEMPTATDKVNMPDRIE